MDLQPHRNFFQKVFGQISSDPFCIAVSVGEQQSRASSRHVLAKNFDECWPLVVELSRSLCLSSTSENLHVRLDCLIDVQEYSWAQFKKELSKTKRNYFRRGVVLDLDFECLFLETELNANAMLIAGSDIETAQLNIGNFNRYARRKYGQAFVLDDSDHKPVWLFNTVGVYLGPDALDPVRLHQDGPFVGNRIISELDVDSTTRFVTKGSDFLSRQVNQNGRFVYGLFPCFDREVSGYNTLRHASSTYAMLEAWEVSRSPELFNSIELALNYLVKNLIHVISLPSLPPGNEMAFLVDTGNEVKLGGNAVCVLALCKYTELTGNRQYMQLLERLAHGMAAMFNTNTGQFVHVLNFPDLSVKEVFRIIYYDGEAAFALMRLYRLTRKPAYLELVERAFEYFIHARHDRSHDHWLSYCVNELTVYKPLRKYFEFGVRNFQDYLDFVLERITTFPTLLELMMAAEQMLQRMRDLPELQDLLGEVDLEKFYRALHIRANRLIAGHFWPELAMFFANPQRIEGSFFIRHQAFRVRIDDVEHYLSGLIAYRKFLLERKPVRFLPLEAETSAELVPPSLGSQLDPKPLPIRAVSLPAALSGEANGEIHPELLLPIRGGKLFWRAAECWNRMRTDALRVGLILLPVSDADTYRTLEVQKRLFFSRFEPCGVEAALSVHWSGCQWKLKSGQSLTAVPGKSIYGWGIAIDVIQDQGGRIVEWLSKHAHRYGFCWHEQDKPWRLVYFAGDHVTEILPALATPESDFKTWDSGFISRATPGHWIQSPAESWSATGLFTWEGSMKEGQVAVVAADPKERGIRVERLAKLPFTPAGLVTSMSDQELASFAVPTALPVYRVSSNRRALIDLAYLARRHFRGKVIGVTGTAGKTTTVGMIAHALTHLSGDVFSTKGNANLPAGVAWNLCQVPWSTPYAVLELAIGSMAENTRMARPDVAVVTNIGPSHLEFHGTTRNVALKKARIFTGVPDGGAAVICLDTEHSDLLVKAAQTQGLRVLTYGFSQQATVWVERWDPVGGELLLHTPKGMHTLRSGLEGKHMVLNTLACVAVGLALELDVDVFLSGLSNFSPVSGRGKVHDIAFHSKQISLIDESYNANPVSMQASIELAGLLSTKSAAKRNVMILGDMLELGNDSDTLHRALEKVLIQQKPDLVVLCGNLIRVLQEPLLAAGIAHVAVFSNVEDLTLVLAELLQDGDQVLVKGSHGTGLHRLVSLLTSSLG
ncbi:MAG: Mur ligase family protein [Limnobacter sp.]|nr:Mur ligase family protein [Limnobacter sp.]MCZ8014056.1 Mur ligase family protein [Limnobacter sp.]